MMRQLKDKMGVDLTDCGAHCNKETNLSLCLSQSLLLNNLQRFSLLWPQGLRPWVAVPATPHKPSFSRVCVRDWQRPLHALLPANSVSVTSELLSGFVLVHSGTGKNIELWHGWSNQFHDCTKQISCSPQFESCQGDSPQNKCSGCGKQDVYDLVCAPFGKVLLSSCEAHTSFLSFPTHPHQSDI